MLNLDEELEEIIAGHAAGEIEHGTEEELVAWRAKKDLEAKLSEAYLSGYEAGRLDERKRRSLFGRLLQLVERLPEHLSSWQRRTTRPS